MIELLDQHRSGVLPEHKGMRLVGAQLDCCRLTIPAREALEANGAQVTPAQAPLVPDGGQWVPASGRHWSVTLAERCPSGLVAVQQVGGSSAICIRLDNEPEYPNETPVIWPQIDLTPCPKCGGALIWYEAGYVPGYRVCAGRKHHHWIAR